jgi:N-glycosylase/DNA lyase
MRIVMDVDLDSTLGCGQAHRWHNVDGSWEGVLGDSVITLTQTSDGFECEGTEDRGLILDYFRHDDDLDSIYEECARSDEFVSSLIDRCKGLRILRQPHYECIATYILATNANVKRIGAMVEGVCRT